MERYEAILEQLKKAQGRGMETITNRLDFVVQSLEELIQEAKSSIQEALPESADECLPVDEVRATLDAFRDEAAAERRRAAELETRIAALESTKKGPQTATSIELMRALDSAVSQSELLKELLPAISEHAARAVVLVLRDGKATAWSGIGFTDGEVLRAWQGDAAESAALTKLLEVSKPVRFTPPEDDLFHGWLADEDMPAEVLLIPVVLRGKLMGAVYVDRLEGQPWAPETAQILVAQVCWLIDTLQYRQVAATSLAEPVEISGASEATGPGAPPVEKAPPSQDAADEIEQSVAMGGEPVPTTDAEGPTVAETGDVDEVGFVPDDDQDSGVFKPDLSATMKIEVSDMGAGETPTADEVVEESFEPEEPPEAEHEPEIASESFEPESPTEPEFDAPSKTDFEPPPEEAPEDDVPQPQVEAEASVAAPEPAEAPSEVLMPAAPVETEVEDEEEPEPEETEESEPEASQFLDEPPPVKPVQPPPDEPEEEVSEDEAQREEARRFARLLVSEIKLYNEEQVERGRETKDLYHRLQEDINRSREMFEKRISPEIRGDQDFFQDELVRILADGDPDALGM